MKFKIQTLGWWMRRTSRLAMGEAVPFYEQALGLPRMRAYGDHLVLLWAGEDLVFEIKTDDHPTRFQGDPASAACLPVFRSHDLDATRARLKSFGHEPVAERQSPWGHTSFYRSTDGLVTGIEWRSPDSPLAADARALRAWREGPAALGNLPPLPAGLHYLSRVIRRVADVEASAGWYRDVLGLDPCGIEQGSHLFSLGDNVTLEVAPGGSRATEPADRSELADSYILRIHDFDDAVSGLQARGCRFNGSLIVFEETTRLRYVVDPEGQLTGIEERGLIRDYLEDVEADRRWRACHAATRRGR